MHRTQKAGRQWQNIHSWIQQGGYDMFFNDNTKSYRATFFFQISQVIESILYSIVVTATHEIC